MPVVLGRGRQQDGLADRGRQGVLLRVGVRRALCAPLSRPLLSCWAPVVDLAGAGARGCRCPRPARRPPRRRRPCRRHSWPVDGVDRPPRPSPGDVGAPSRGRRRCGSSAAGGVGDRAGCRGQRAVAGGERAERRRPAPLAPRATPPVAVGERPGCRRLTSREPERVPRAGLAQNSARRAEPGRPDRSPSSSDSRSRGQVEPVGRARRSAPFATVRRARERCPMVGESPARRRAGPRRRPGRRAAPDEPPTPSGQVPRALRDPARAAGHRRRAGLRARRHRWRPRRGSTRAGRRTGVELGGAGGQSSRCRRRAVRHPGGGLLVGRRRSG